MNRYVWDLCEQSRITIELFVEHFPRGVEILQRRCKTGSQQSLVHTRVHKLLNGCAFFIGSPRFFFFPSSVDII